MLDRRTHRLHLVQILTYIYKNTQLSSALGFKGGTAAYLFYDLPRFSTDLDFDLVNLQIDISQLSQEVNDYVKDRYEVLDYWDKHYTLLWKLSYGRDLMNIKIEISKRDASMFEYQPRNLYGNTVNVIMPGHLIVQKMLALKGRPTLANRDIFDLHYFLSGQYALDIDYDLLSRVTGVDAREYLVQLESYLIENSPRKILDGLGEVVDPDKKDWIRNDLFNETLELLRMQIESL